MPIFVAPADCPPVAQPCVALCSKNHVEGTRVNYQSITLRHGCCCRSRLEGRQSGERAAHTPRTGAEPRQSSGRTAQPPCTRAARRTFTSTVCIVAVCPRILRTATSCARCRRHQPYGHGTSGNGNSTSSGSSANYCQRCQQKHTLQQCSSIGACSCS